MGFSQRQMKSGSLAADSQLIQAYFAFLFGAWLDFGIDLAPVLVRRSAHHGYTHGF